MSIENQQIVQTPVSYTHLDVYKRQTKGLHLSELGKIMLDTARAEQNSLGWKVN